MVRDTSQIPIGVLFSGGLDSAILVGHLLGEGYLVQPIYVAGGLVWQQAELAWARAFLEALSHERLRPLFVLDLPLADLYVGHWSVTGRGIPDGASPDEAVYLPGRNPLLIIKARLWCQLHGMNQLAIGALSGNPFADATEGFFRRFEDALDQAMCGHVELLRPFALLSKRDVLALGRQHRLELTFSCLAPQEGLHCGNCNKCAERAAAFVEMGLADPTRYLLEPRPTLRTVSCFE